jgi:hypothetical protein
LSCRKLRKLSLRSFQLLLQILTLLLRQRAAQRTQRAAAELSGSSGRTRAASAAQRACRCGPLSGGSIVGSRPFLLPLAAKLGGVCGMELLQAQGIKQGSVRL